MTDWGRQTCSQISQLTTSIRAFLNRLAVRLEKEVQPASLKTGRTSFHSSRLTSLLSIAALTLPCKHTQSQLSRTGRLHSEPVVSVMAIYRELIPVLLVNVFLP